MILLYITKNPALKSGRIQISIIIPNLKRLVNWQSKRNSKVNIMYSADSDLLKYMVIYY